LSGGWREIAIPLIERLWSPFLSAIETQQHCRLAIANLPKLEIEHNS